MLRYQESMHTMAEKKSVITIVNETRDNVKGIMLTAFVPFDKDNGGFYGEKAGSKYSVPVKARDAENKLLKDGDSQLYMLLDGGTTTAPFMADGRTVRAEVATEAKQATPHNDFSKTITDENVVWPDGNIRAINISLKANNPQTVEEYKASKAAASANRKGATITKLSDDELIAELARRKAAVASK